MEAMRQSWTDDRLDGFRESVNLRFDGVNQRFDEVDRRFDKVDSELGRLNDRLDGLHHTMVYGFVAMTAAMMTGYAATIGLLVTQL